MAEADQLNLTSLTVDLLSAYVSNNNVQHGDLAGLIQSTHSALKAINEPQPEVPAEPEHKPAVSIRKSLASGTHLISMIDGKPYQTLKRHLAKHELTPAQYRERYGLPKNYPMVAPAYSEQRRAIAQRLGLGRRAGAQASAPTEVAAPQPESLEPAKAAPAKSAKAAAAPKARSTRAAAKPASKSVAEKAPTIETTAAIKTPKTSRAKSKAAAPAPEIQVEATPTKKAPAKKAVATPSEAAKPARKRLKISGGTGTPSA